MPAQPRDMATSKLYPVICQALCEGYVPLLDNHGALHFWACDSGRLAPASVTSALDRSEAGQVWALLHELVGQRNLMHTEPR